MKINRSRTPVIIAFSLVLLIALSYQQHRINRLGIACEQLSALNKALSTFPLRDLRLLDKQDATPMAKLHAALAGSSLIAQGRNEQGQLLEVSLVLDKPCLLTEAQMSELLDLLQRPAHSPALDLVVKQLRIKHERSCLALSLALLRRERV